MHPIVAPDSELASRIAQTGEPQLLSELFHSRKRRWPYHLIVDECFTVGLFYDLEQQLLPNVAFTLIPQAVEITLEQDSTNLFTTALSLLAGLAEKSNTTEIPEILVESWEKLQQRADRFAPTTAETWRFLKSWYRR
jgi:hypothetical protein